jgi:hypothetical protein
MVFEHGSRVYCLSHDNTRHGGVAFTWGEPTLQATGALPAPNLRLDALTASSATFSLNADPTYIETRFQRTSSADAPFAAPQSDVQSTTADRYYRIESPLSGATTYRERAQVRTSAGWSDWSLPIVFTTAAPPSYAGSGLPGGNIFTAPRFGQPVGPIVTISWWNGLGAATLLEWSPVYTTSWTTITSTGLSGGSYAWDASAVTDLSFVRVRITVGGSLYEHPGFTIDKTAVQDLYHASMPGSFTGWQRLHEPTSAWAIGTFAQQVCSGFTGLQRPSQTVWGQLHSPGPSNAILAYNAGYGDGHRVTVTGAVFSGGGGPFWEYWYNAEHAKIGACVASGSRTAGDQQHIAAFFQTNQLGHPIGSCPSGDNMQGEFVVSLFHEPTATTVEYSVGGLYAAGSTYPFTCSSTCYEREWDYHVALEWERPDPITVPNRVRVRGWLGAPYSVLIDETVDLTDRAGNPVVILS